MSWAVGGGLSEAKGMLGRSLGGVYVDDGGEASEGLFAAPWGGGGGGAPRPGSPLLGSPPLLLF